MRISNLMPLVSSTTWAVKEVNVWEYNLVKVAVPPYEFDPDRLLQEALDRCSLDSWELVSTDYRSATDDKWAIWRLIFKRPKEPA